MIGFVVIGFLGNMKKHNGAKQWLATLSLLAAAGLTHAGFSEGENSVAAMPEYDSVSQAELPTISSLSSKRAVSSHGKSLSYEKGFSSETNIKLDENGYEIGKPLPPFTDFVHKATGKTLPLFGSHFFHNATKSFDVPGNMQVNPDYIIGSGDLLQIKGWGMVDIDLTLTVDRNGAIHLPRVGSVSLAGIRYRDLQAVLKKSISRVFSNFNLTASLVQSRAVQVYVLGHARRPGSYSLSAMDTMLNALLKAGGPSDSGSLRNVTLMREGKAAAEMDLYAILVDGDKSGDQTLRDGDVIKIPAASARVAVFGDVKMPAIYEANAGESAEQLLHWAGGVESAAEGKELIVGKSVANRFVTQVKTQNYEADLAGILLRAGDVFWMNVPGAQAVSVQKSEAYVHVGGEVQRTGTFQIRKGETLRQLISRLGGVTEEAYVFATQLKRDSVRKLQQTKLDEVAARYERQLEQNAAVRISKLTDKDNIAAAQAEIDRHRQLASQMRMIKAEGRVVLEMKNAGAELNDLPDLDLHDGDQVEIPRKPGTVNVLGAVYQNNAFIYLPHRQVRDYLSLAGGVVESGDKSATYVLRADGTVSSNSDSWFLKGLRARVNPGDTIVVPETVNTGTWTQALKEWTTILYQFGLGAAGLKVLR